MEQLDIRKTLYLRYENKQRMLAIIKTIGWIDPHKDIKNLLDWVLDFQSNVLGTYGLDLYGTILNFSRAIALVNTNYFGFQNTDFKPFSVAPYFKGIFEDPKNIVMSNSNYKLLLQALFLSTKYNGSMHNLNRIIQILFAYKGKCCVIRKDENNIEFLSDFEFEDWHRKLFEKEIIPIPLGVGYTFRKI